MSDVDVQPSISSEEFLRTGRDVRISNQPGFLCKVRMKALIDVPPEEVCELYLKSCDLLNAFGVQDAVHSRCVILKAGTLVFRTKVYIYLRIIPYVPRSRLIYTS